LTLAIKDVEGSKRLEVSTPTAILLSRLLNDVYPDRIRISSYHALS